MSKYFDYLEAHGGLDPEGQEPEEPECDKGLCFFCREIDQMDSLIRISGNWLAHKKCASERDVVNEVRR